MTQVKQNKGFERCIATVKTLNHGTGVITALLIALTMLIVGTAVTLHTTSLPTSTPTVSITTTTTLIGASITVAVTWTLVRLRLNGDTDRDHSRSLFATLTNRTPQLPTINKEAARAVFLAVLMITSIVAMAAGPLTAPAAAEEDEDALTLQDGHLITVSTSGDVEIIDPDGGIVDAVDVSGETGSSGDPARVTRADDNSAIYVVMDGSDEIAEIDVATGDVETWSTSVTTTDTTTIGTVEGDVAVAGDGQLEILSGSTGSSVDTVDTGDLDAVGFDISDERILVSGYDHAAEYHYEDGSLSEDYHQGPFDGTLGDGLLYVGGVSYAESFTWTEGTTYEFDNGEVVEHDNNIYDPTMPVIADDNDGSYVHIPARNDDGNMELYTYDWSSMTTLGSSDLGIPAATDVYDAVSHDSTVFVRSPDLDTVHRVDQVDNSVEDVTEIRSGVAYMETHSTSEPGDDLEDGEGEVVVDGHVMTEDGVPVEDATVEVWMVDHDELAEQSDLETAEELEAEAEDLLDEAQDPLHDGWYDQDGMDYDVLGEYEDADTKVPLIHHSSAWDEDATNYAGIIHSGYTLDKPAIKLEPGEHYEISVWDPEKSSEGDGWFADDPIDSQIQGATLSDETVELNRIGPDGSVVDRHASTTRDRLVTEGAGPLGQERKVHEASHVIGPDPGVYEVTAQGSDFSYYVVSGDPDEIASTIEDDLRDEADTLTNSAENIREHVDSGTFDRTTETTNADGRFTVTDDSVPENATLAIQAHKGAHQVVEDVDDLEDLSLQDIRDKYEETEFNGSVYVSADPERVSPPDEDVTVEVHEFDTPGYSDLDELLERYEWLEDVLEESHYDSLEELFNDPSAILDADEVDVRYEAVVVGMVEGTPLEEPFKAVAEEQGVTTEIDTDHDRETKEDQLTLAQDVIDGATGSTPDPGDDDRIDIDVGDDGNVTVTLPGGDVDEDTITVIVDRDDGTSEVLEDVQVELDEALAGLLGDDEIVAEVEMDEDEAVAHVEILALTEDGDVIRDRGLIDNPAFDGEVPDVESVNSNTLRPGVGERVQMDVTSGDSVATVTDAVVYTPAGEVIEPGVEDGDVSWTPEETGVHVKQLELESHTGDTVVETVRVEAVDEPVSMPPGVLVTSGPSGTYAVTERVDSASVDSTAGGSKIAVTAQFDEGHVPDNELRVRGLSVPYNLQQWTVRATDGTGTVISDPVEVSLHVNGLGDPAHLRVDGEPLPLGSSNSVGEVTEADGAHVITTWVEGGEVEINLDDDPGLIDRLLWSLEIRLGGWSLTMVPVGTGAVGASAALSAVAIKRRGDH